MKSFIQHFENFTALKVIFNTKFNQIALPLLIGITICKDDSYTIDRLTNPTVENEFQRDRKGDKKKICK